MTKAHPELWAGRDWNTPVGRVIWWVDRGKKSHVARCTARTFYLELLADLGPGPARQQLAEQGIADLPAWLVGSEL